MIDRHNHVRQHELGIEAEWLTTDCWFRLYCSAMGILVTNANLAMKHEGVAAYIIDYDAAEKWWRIAYDNAQHALDTLGVEEEDLNAVECTNALNAWLTATPRQRTNAAGLDRGQFAVERVLGRRRRGKRDEYLIKLSATLQSSC